MKREYPLLLFPISLVVIALVISSLTTEAAASSICGSYSTDCQCVTQGQAKPDFCFKIAENSPNGTCLGDLIDVSEDFNFAGFQTYLNSNRALKFELPESNICTPSNPTNASIPTVTDWFRITNTSLGTFSTITEIDYEYYQSICDTFCLQINGAKLQYANPVDGDGSLSFLFFIDIVNVNDNPPIFRYTEDTNSTVFEGSIEEAVYQTVCFSELIATDKDDPENLNADSISYSVVTSPANFSVEPDDNSNQLCVSNLVSLDRETMDTVSFVIKAEDEGNLSSTITVLLNIIDINDNYPYFIDPDTNPEVFENATIGTVIAQYTAADEDIGINAELTYSINTNVFAINSSTGEVFVNEVLDAEQNDNVEFTVTVQDGGGKSDAKSISVSILNVNDNPPFIVDPFDHYFTTPEGVKTIGSVIRQIKINDKDIGETDFIAHILSGSEYVSGDFRILVPGASIFFFRLKYIVDELDYELVQEILVNFTISDGGSPELSFSSFLLINVTDINDNPPYLSQTAFSVSEDSNPGTTIVSLSEYFQDDDSDANNNNKLDRFITYEDEHVAVDGNGHVTVRNIDRETIPGGLITFNVTFFDQGEPDQLNSTETIELTVIDVNDNSPEFVHSEGYWFEVDENDPVIDFGEVNAMDIDTGLNGKVIYTIINSTDLFTVDNITGELSLNKALDREARDRYTLTILAKDCGTPSRSATINVTVIVRDQNDNDPVFDEGMIKRFTIPSDSKVNTVIAQLNATDRDTGINARINFTLNDSDIFSIDTEGLLRNKILLDGVADSEQKLLVTVYNDNNRERNSTEIITIYINSTTQATANGSGDFQSLVLYSIGGAVFIALLAAITIVLCCLCCLCYHRRRSKSRTLPPIPSQTMTPKKGVLKVSSFKEEDDAGYEGSVNGDIPRSPTVNFSNNYQVRYFSQDQSMKAAPVKTETVRLEEKLSTEYVESPQIPTKDETNQPQEAEEVSSPPLSEDLSSNSSLSNSVYHSTANQYYEHQPKNQHLPLREDTLKKHNEAISSGLIYQPAVVHDSRRYGPPPPQEPPYTTGNGHYTAHGGEDLLPPNIQHYLSSNHHSNQSISAPVSHYVSQNGTPPSTESSPRIQFISPPDHSHGNHHNHRRLPHEKPTTPAVYYSNHHHGAPPISPHGGGNHYAVDHPPPPTGSYYDDPPGPPQIQNGGALQHYNSSSTTSSSNHRPDISPPSPPQSLHYPPAPPPTLAALHHPPPSSTRHGRHSHDRPPIMDGHLSPLAEYPPPHHSYIPPAHSTTHSRNHVTYQHMLQHSRLYNNMSRQSLEDTSTVASSLLDNYLQFETHPQKHDDYLLSDAISVDDR